MSTPLKDLRVLDASRVLAGPFCGQLLGDLGADVIKIERPGQGDDTRQWGPPFHSTMMSAYFLSANRSKRSVALDLSKPEGLALFHKLAAKCDILLENFRTDSADKMGISAQKLLARHPHLILCSITGYGHTGPMSMEPGYDLAVQALSGLMAVTGPTEGPPSKVGVALADVLTGMYAAVAILAAVHARQQSGHGYAIDLALLDCAIASQVNLAQSYLLTGQVPPRPGNAHFQIVPYALFEVRDGWLTLNVGNDRQWQDFCKAAESRELASDLRFTTNPLRVQNRALLTPMLETLLKQRTMADWSERLTTVNVPHSPVQDYAAVFGMDQVAARGMKMSVTDPEGKPVDLIGSPFHFDGADLKPPQFPPCLGEHTAQVLDELLGVDADRFQVLKQAGVVG